MFWLIKTRLRVLIRDRANLFWSFIFPLCLGTFFYLGFGNLLGDSPFNSINLYIASDYSDANLAGFLAAIDVDEETKLFKIKADFTKEFLEQKLTENAITGYLFVENNQLYYRINENGMEQTVTKSVLDQYVQISQVILQVESTNPEKEASVIDSLQNDHRYLETIRSKRQASSDSMYIYFYALIAMTCTYGCFWGISLVNDTQANQSALAARITSAPTHRLKIIVSYSLAAFIMHFSGCLINFFYLNYILGVDFGGNIPLIILVIFVGTLCGIAFGALLSSLIKVKGNQKDGIIAMITLALNALSGLMFPDLKYLIAKYIPFLGYINPSASITDALHCLYYYEGLGHYYFYLLLLSIMTVIFITGSYLFMRGSRYDSI
jgi:ABC-2 type transport system permease protein